METVREGNPVLPNNWAQNAHIELPTLLASGESLDMEKRPHREMGTSAGIMRNTCRSSVVSYCNKSGKVNITPLSSVVHTRCKGSTLCNQLENIRWK